MPNVLFVMLDGLRPDALSPERTPNLLRAASQGAHTLTARSVMPSMTLPCHMSIFHSVPPSRHGIGSNIYTPQVRPVIGLIDAANDAGNLCAMITNWEELRDISRPGSLHFSLYLRNGYDLEAGDQLLVEQATRLIRTREFNFIFLYLGTIDVAGHSFGWMSDGYLEQVRRMDDEIGTLLDVLPSNMTMIVHADHGGHDRTHGTDMPEDMTIPWFIVGSGVKPGHVIQREVSLIDTAPTIARLLGFEPPKDWEGTVVEEALL